jgi:hypothetical protein
MSEWQWETWRHPDTTVAGDPEPERQSHTAYVTAAGAEWLASASAFPRSVQALWSARPTAPSVLPCGTVFDVVNLPVLFGRRVLEQLWAAGPGSGPVALHRGRVLLLVAPGCAQRLPSLLSWEEWGGSVPPLMCHGPGDAVTVPPLYGDETGLDTEGGSSRWVVAPDTRRPWLPGPDVLLWACIRAARAAAGPCAPAPAPSAFPAGSA